MTADQPIDRENLVIPDDVEAIAAAQKRANRIETRRLRIIKWMMDEAEGRLWLFDLLQRCHVFGSPFIAGVGDVTNFQLGEQNIGFKIYNDITEVAMDKYPLMIKEGKKAYGE